jgi:hypothetical protein
MSQVTPLASGTLNGAATLAVELIQPDSMPAAVRINWPAQPTITDPKRINVTINAVMTILARASARHAAIRAKRLQEFGRPVPLVPDFCTRCMGFAQPMTAGEAGGSPHY